MSLLPSTLLNSSSNEDQTLEIHSEILEPLAHSQTLSRWEIPHKNILDSDSILAWECNWEDMTGGAAEHTADNTMVCLPLAVAGLYDTIRRARLYVNGRIISELDEAGKYLALKSNFQSHEHKTEISDFFSYADNNITCNGQITGDNRKIRKTPGDKEIGPRQNAGNVFKVEASLKLHQLFAVLKDAQLDTNSIHGKIMIEIDWNNDGNTFNQVQYIGTAVQAGDRGITVNNPRLILDFLTYNDEVQAQIKATIFGDGNGISMPYREVALVRKNVNAAASAASNSEDFAIGMTGRAVQKIYVSKIMNTANNDVNSILGNCRSDLLEQQKWNIRINDLLIYDRDVANRAEEFNYVQQTGEAQFTCAPATWERRNNGVADSVNYVANDNVWAATQVAFDVNGTPANTGGLGNAINTPTYPANALPARGDYAKFGSSGYSALPQTGDNNDNVPQQRMGRQNYLAVNCAKYMTGAENPINALRIGSTPIIFNLQYNGANDADTTARTGTLYFFVEYLKLMNLKNGEVTIMDL